MAALERAIAAAEPECRTVGIRQHLDLDVARMFEKLFGIDLRIAEGAARFLADKRKRIGKLRTRSDDAHAATAAAACRLEDQRKADLSGDACKASGSSGRAPSEPGTHGTFASRMARLAATLSPMVRMHSGLGPMKVRPDRATIVGKGGILGEEPVSGMNCLCARHLRSKQNRGTIEIALPCRSRADTDGGIGVL